MDFQHHQQSMSGCVTLRKDNCGEEWMRKAGEGIRLVLFAVVRGVLQPASAAFSGGVLCQIFRCLSWVLLYALLYDSKTGFIVFLPVEDFFLVW